MNEFNECVHEVFSAAGDIYANELFLKRTPTSDRLLADSELRYPGIELRKNIYGLDNYGIGKIQWKS